MLVLLPVLLFSLASINAVFPILLLLTIFIIVINNNKLKNRFMIQDIRPANIANDQQYKLDFSKKIILLFWFLFLFSIYKRNSIRLSKMLSVEITLQPNANKMRKNFYTNYIWLSLNHTISSFNKKKSVKINN